MKYVTSITLDGKRVKIDERVPRNDLDWYMGRVHVGTSDDEIRADIAKRCSNPAYTPALVRQTQAYALYVHRKNQELFTRYRF